MVREECVLFKQIRFRATCTYVALLSFLCESGKVLTTEFKTEAHDAEIETSTGSQVQPD